MLHTHTHIRATNSFDLSSSRLSTFFLYRLTPLRTLELRFFSRLLARRHNKFPESKVHEAIPPPTLSVRDITSGTFQYLSMSRLEKHPLDASRIKIVFHDIFQILNSNNYDSYLG